MQISPLQLAQHVESYHAMLAPTRLRASGTSQLNSLRNPFAPTPARYQTFATTFAAQTMFVAAAVQKPLTLGYTETSSAPPSTKTLGFKNPIVRTLAQLGVVVGLGSLLALRGTLTGIWVLLGLFYILFQSIRAAMQTNLQPLQMRLKTPELSEVDTQLQQTATDAKLSAHGKMPYQFEIDMQRHQDVQICDNLKSICLSTDSSQSYAQILDLCDQNERWAYTVASLVNQSLIHQTLTELFPTFETQTMRQSPAAHFIQFKTQAACIYYNKLHWSFRLSKIHDNSIEIRLYGMSASGTPFMVSQNDKHETIDTTVDTSSQIVLEAVVHVLKPDKREDKNAPIETQALRVKLLDSCSQQALGTHGVDLTNSMRDVCA